MSQTIGSTNLSISLISSVSGTVAGFASIPLQYGINMDVVSNYAPGGSGLNQANLIYDGNSLSVVNGTPVVLNLTSVAQPFGTDTFTNIKAMLITSASTNTGNLIVGGDATAPFLGPWTTATDTFTLLPGDTMLLSSALGWTVAAGNENLQFAASAGTVSYSVYIIGS